MNSKLETLVDYLAGQASVRVDLLRREMEDPASEARRLLAAAQEWSRCLFSDHALQRLGLTPHAGRHQGHLQELTPPARQTRGLTPLGSPKLTRPARLAAGSTRRGAGLVFSGLLFVTATTIAVLLALNHHPPYLRGSAQPEATGHASSKPAAQGSGDQGEGSEVPGLSSIASQESGGHPGADPGGRVDDGAGKGPGSPSLVPITSAKGVGSPTSNPAGQSGGGSVQGQASPGGIAIAKLRPISPSTLVRVPRLVGLELRQADELAKKAGLVLELRNGEKGRVLTQSPPPGTEVAPGAAVEITCGAVTPIKLPSSLKGSKK
jgi:hypothetical protein